MGQALERYIYGEKNIHVIGHYVGVQHLLIIGSCLKHNSMFKVILIIYFLEDFVEV